MSADPFLALLSAEMNVVGTVIDELVERTVLLGGTSETAAQELAVIDEQGALTLLARAYPVDVKDRAALTQAINDADLHALREALPKRLALSSRTVPIALQGRRLTVACTAPVELNAFMSSLDELGFALSMSLVPVLTTEALLAVITEQVYAVPIPERLQRVLNPQAIDVDFDIDTSEFIETTTAVVAPLSADDAIAELSRAKNRDAILETLLQFTYRRMYRAALFVSQGGRFTCFDLLHPTLESAGVKGATIKDGEHLLGRVAHLQSPILGPIDETDPLALLLGRRPTAVLAAPIVLGTRTVAVVCGDNDDDAVDPTLLGDLQRVIPAVQAALARIIKERKSSPPTEAVATSTTPEAPAPAGDPSTQAPAPAPIPPSPGAVAKEALLTATAHAWLRASANESITALLRALDGKDIPQDTLDTATQRLLAAGLNAMPDVCRAFPGRAASLPDSTAAVRAALVDSPLFVLLKKLGTDLCAPLAAWAINDQNDAARRFAGVVLAHELQLTACLPLLGRCLTDANARIAMVAIDAVSSMRDAPATEAVLTRLRDLCRRGNDVERRYAIRATAALADSGAVPVLIDLIGVRPLGDEALAALVDICRQDFGGAERRWRAWYTEHKDEPRQRWLLTALLNKEQTLRTAAARELSESVALLGFDPGASESDRLAAFRRLCTALGEDADALLRRGA